MIKSKCLLFFLTLLTLGCSDIESDLASCNGLIDSIKIVDSQSINTKQYYLVLRVRGLQDKTEIVEIYDHKPNFDFCGHSPIEPMAGNSIDTRSFNNVPQLVKAVLFNTSNNIMNVKYVLASEASEDKKIEFILQ